MLVAAVLGLRRGTLRRIVRLLLLLLLGTIEGVRWDRTEEATAGSVKQSRRENVRIIGLLLWWVLRCTVSRVISWISGHGQDNAKCGSGGGRPGACVSGRWSSCKIDDGTINIPRWEVGEDEGGVDSYTSR